MIYFKPTQLAGEEKGDVEFVGQGLIREEAPNKAPLTSRPCLSIVGLGRRACLDGGARLIES